MAKRIVWAPEAVADRIQILDYWYKRLGTKAYSQKLDQVFKETIELLSHFPLLGRQLKGRDEVLKKMDEIENKLKEKTEKVKQESMRQLEAARKTAAAAAWWLFPATVVSGGASALGGILALTI